VLLRCRAARRRPPAEEIVSALLNSWTEVLALTC
jgi:hypothetical protein